MDSNFVSKGVIAIGLLPDGRRVEISEIKTGRAMLGHDADTHVAVDVGAGNGMPAASFGFLSEGDAMRFVTSYDNQEYDGYDANGRKAVTVRHGLGCPDALLSKRGGMTQFNRDGGDNGPVRIPSFNVSGSGAGAVSAGVPGSQSVTSRSGPAPAPGAPTPATPATNQTVDAYTPTPGAMVDGQPQPAVSVSGDQTHVDTSLPGLSEDTADDGD